MTPSYVPTDVVRIVPYKMEPKKMHIYLASPWFSLTQKEVMDKVRDVILEFPDKFSLFAPYYDGIVLTKDNDSSEMRKKVFEIDVMRVTDSDLVVAVIDDFDPGTIFEMGIACRGKMGYGIGKFADGNLSHISRNFISIPILAYSNVPHRGLNVMLAQACVGFANGVRELRVCLKSIEDLIANPDIWTGDFI